VILDGAGITMKRDGNEKVELKPEKPERAYDDKAGAEAVSKEAALTALHDSLLTGTQTALPAEQAMEAAGMLGNQNVLQLMDSGADLHRAINGAGMEIDTQGLAKTLSGPPDGPVCAMEAFI